MSRFYSHINTAKTIISNYNGEIALSVFLKKLFATEKKYGSRDRREVSSLCYNYFRIGNALADKSIEEKLFTGHFLCIDKSSEILLNAKPEWYDKATLPLADKISISGIDIERIFAFTEEFSEGINSKAFNTSFLVQPKLFIRVRPGKQKIVKQKLDTSKISFEQIDYNCIAFKNGTKLEEVAGINHEVVIQDFNSQRVGELMLAAKVTQSAEVWDCCAASGGKSIMAYDLLHNVRLTVSDIRPSIIKNLDQRFSEAGIKNYRSFIADLTVGGKLLKTMHHNQYDLIICDAPCSGSGTWSRTPEQLKFFDFKEIERYSRLQISICKNTVPFIKKGGYFLYITCSVFKKENEKVVDFIINHLGLTLLKKELLTGYEIKADTMFAALFRFS